MLTIFQKSDAEITEQVVQELCWDYRTEKSPIRVSVVDGIVTLSGRVKYYAIKVAAEEAARRIAGVEAVQDTIDVMVPAGEFRADCEIAEAVTRAFAWNVLVPHEQIAVLVNNGIVNLSGSVDHLFQREEAERAIINLLGVRGTTNDLVVKIQVIPVEALSADSNMMRVDEAEISANSVEYSANRGKIREGVHVAAGDRSRRWSQHWKTLHWEETQKEQTKEGAAR